MKRRMHNIFKEDGKALIVALDHGIGDNVLPELQDTGNIIKDCLQGGADGFLVTPGIAMNFTKELGNSALILRSDGATNSLSLDGAPFQQTVTVEQAIRLGADGVMCMDFPGSKQESQTAMTLAALVEEGIKWQLPVCAEALPRGFEFGDHDDIRSIENLILAARMAAERGADVLKVPYTGDPESFKRLVESTYVPVMVLGGNVSDSPEAFLTDIKDAMDAGAAGAFIGRNIYQSLSPKQMSQALAALIHGQASVESALSLLD